MEPQAQRHIPEIVQQVKLHVGHAELEGDLVVPSNARGVVLFAHGSGSSRHSPRNRFVASYLRSAARVGTLLVDLLSLQEEGADEWTRAYRFDIDLLSRRLVSAIQWLEQQPATRGLNIGLFGASTGAAAALVAAARRPDTVAAVVSRGGRPDLAGEALTSVAAPTLFVVGSHDVPVLQLNKAARRLIPCTTSLEIVQGASHLFEEPGALDQVAKLASAWFARYLR